MITYVHDTAVDVAKLLEAEKPGAVGGVIENIRLKRRTEKLPVSQVPSSNSQLMPVEGIKA